MKKCEHRPKDYEREKSGNYWCERDNNACFSDLNIR